MSFQIIILSSEPVWKYQSFSQSKNDSEFVPSCIRTDNAIKNHWNSSVKKKFDAYMSSGLLDEFQGQPLPENSLSFGIQPNREDVVDKDRTIECSQGSDVVKCSQFEPMRTDNMFYSNELQNMSFVSTPQQSESSIALDENLDSVNELLQSYLGFGTSDTVENMPATPVRIEDQFVSEPSNSVGLGCCQPVFQTSSTSRTSLQPLELDIIANSRDDFIYVDSPIGDVSKTSNHLTLDEANNAPKLVPVDIFSSVHDGKRHLKLDEAKGLSKLACSKKVDDDVNAQEEEQDLRALSDEYPHFPSLDIPVFNCDLMTSSSELQQSYSPLGFRQLMMSSMNFSSPRFTLHSPAAKSYTSKASSIGKKQLCDAYEEKKNQVEVEGDTNMRMSISTDGFSSLDSFLDEEGASDSNYCQKASCEVPLQDITEKLDSTSSSMNQHKQESIRIDTDAKVDSDTTY